jgi:hypothetical protein
MFFSTLLNRQIANPLDVATFMSNPELVVAGTSPNGEPPMIPPFALVDA